VTPTQRSPEVAAIAAARGVALQPIGAYEQHGPHLPLATDAIIAEALTARAAAQLPASLPAWVLPVLSYGKSIEHLGRPGTVTLSTTTLLAVCRDVAASVAASGIRTLVFVNAHGGNPELLQLVARDIKAELGVDTYSVHAPTLAVPDADRIPRPDLEVHAGFSETSVMLALDPERVDLDAAEPDGLAVADALAPLTHVSLFGPIPLPWHVDDLSVTGTIGDPTGANAAWGAAALEAQATALAETIVELATFRYPSPGGAA
jgi:creatinine amidohydrolase